jgi:hypothetical protein
MIIIRVHQGRTADQELTTTTLPTLHTGAHDRFSSSRARPGSPVGDSYAMQPMQVNVTRQVVKEADADSAFGESKGSHQNLGMMFGQSEDHSVMDKVCEGVQQNV